MLKIWLLLMVILFALLLPTSLSAWFDRLPPGTASMAGPVITQPTTASAPPAVAPSTGRHPIVIAGSARFAGHVQLGLDQMRERSPADYQLVIRYVTEIREGAQNWSWSGSSVIQISTTSAAHSPAYAASIILHEAVHVKNWATGNFPVFGCEGEAKSLTAQADYLDRVSEPQLGSWVRGLIGTWC